MSQAPVVGWGIVAGLQGAGHDRRLPLGGDGRGGRMGKAPGLAPGPHVDRKQLARGGPQPPHVPAGARGSGPARLFRGTLPDPGFRTSYPRRSRPFCATATPASLVVSAQQHALMNNAPGPAARRLTCEGPCEARWRLSRVLLVVEVIIYTAY